MSDVDRSPELERDGGRNASCHCITCGDIATPMQVIAVDDDRCLALCEDAAGGRHTVEIALVAVAPGDEVLVHAGTAIA